MRVRILHAVGCVVTNPWEGIVTVPNALRVLINPANESLLGTARPYFPRGGPLPPRAPPGLTTSSRWGGMDAGPGMLYPAQAVDGLVHQMCILFFNSELYFRHFVFFLLSILGPKDGS